MYSISVGNHHGRNKMTRKIPPTFFPTSFSQMVILAALNLHKDLGLEAMKFSSSAGVKVIRLWLQVTPLNLSNNGNRKHASGRVVSHFICPENILNFTAVHSNLT